jgi:hypothetical protein
LIRHEKFLTWTDDNLLRQVVYEGSARRNDLGALRKALYGFFEGTPAVTGNTADAACT